ncbi:MAG: FIST signal transduction protein [Gaiellaceae bacterium]
MTRITAGLSTNLDTAAAAREAAAQAGEELSAAPDLAFLFLSGPHLAQAEEAAGEVLEELAPAHLLGCAAQGVVARTRELEEGPAVAVWAASLPDAAIETFHADAVEAEGAVAVTGFPEVEGADLVALLVDPFSFPAGALLERLNEDAPGTPLVGGIAVGGPGPGAAALVRNGEVHSRGAVGAVLSGVPVKAVVSQGCAPIGHDAVITRAEGNVVFELAGKPALVRLKEEIEGLPEEVQLQAARGLLAGLVIDENLPEYGRGDFLMRGILGADERTGALAFGEAVRVGQTMRFHVRDAESADEDLREALAREVGKAHAAGALLFTCNGRGRSMFTEPDHDARVVGEALGGDALAGFFCGGEIGPVGGRTFLHGFTATMAVFLAEDPGEP